MARRIPPLNPLHAFETAARHGSFSRAATELSVTPAAISRQVKLLENYFGVEFFEREPGGVTLTPEARAYSQALGKAFRQISAATEEFRTQHTSIILTIQGYTTFLVRWLVPRLPDFQARHPHIKVRLISGPATLSPRKESDITIRYGEPRQWTGYARATLLFQDELVPVCSPRLVKNGRGKQALSTPEQIARMPLLLLDARRQDWADWFALSGLKPPREGIQTFEDLTVALEFARRGLGVALAQRRYIEEEQAAGNLVEMSDIVLRRDLGYYALVRHDSAGKSKIEAFFRWLESHAAEIPAPPIAEANQR
ncbi:LysR substrate-binding domain-containing protein [Achromobacter aloeverae]|uniref:Transcriptional regulator n=1 Tax=Achromobacter aloeverae TaxID=1750518 RepID=A0A4Q1HK51_9BURK|nr:LysR substrate-binding domain-containing protein [Achromobacter aloeverae]RXN86973.1 transcriptional regulator [Achromobacter aloeverae]